MRRSSRLPVPSLITLALLTAGAASVVAQEAAKSAKTGGPARNIVREGTDNSGQALFAPLADEPAAGNGGLFLGVNKFSADPDVQPLRFAVNDAIEQCHLFVVELRLLPAKQCFLALSGEPVGERVTRHLADLKQLGVQVVGAEKSTLLRSFVRVRGFVRPMTGLLVVSFSSHGFTDKRVGYVMPSDGLRAFLEDTAIRLSSVEEQMNASQAGHRLLLVDACQERLSDATRSGGMMGGQSMSADFLELLKKPTGQSKLVSCDVGEYSYEHPELGEAGHGVFTYAVLDALRGGAAADEQNVVRLSSVAGYVNRSVRDWIDEQNGRRRADDPVKKQSPSYQGPEAARELPLAKKAGDLATLVASVRRQALTTVFTSELRTRLVETLGQLDPKQEADRELLASTREFVNGKTRVNLFVPYLRGELDRRGKQPLRPVRASFTVREGEDDSSPLASGAQVDLQWQASGASALQTLGTATTSGQGRASIELDRESLPISSGRYYARVSKGTQRKDWALDGFPATSSWRLYVPLPQSPPPQPGAILENSLGMKLAYIPAGEFPMGSPLDEADRRNDEYPHRVRLTRGFHLGVYEVTQGEYQRVMGMNPSLFSAQGDNKSQVKGQDTSRFPVENVSWDEAVEFCRLLSASPVEQAAGRKYRLPTEAEWEYACRAGTTTPFYWGGTLNGDRANCDGSTSYGTVTKGKYLERTTRVGSYASNAWGLYDMHGNVWEWCSDWSDADYYRASPPADPPGPSGGSVRVRRGGSWSVGARSCRAAYRFWYSPSYRDSDLGFRVALFPSGLDR